MPITLSVMRSLTCTSTQQPVALVKELARSGEGVIWQTDRPGYLAKVYHTYKPERVRKLEVMVAHPPTDPNAAIDHVSFAWPQSLLTDENYMVAGFLMPAIANSVNLLEVYNPQRRQKVLPGFNWLYLHTTAMNIASIVGAIHYAGYVLGDIKPENILVDNRALPAVIDTDSFQVRHPETGELFLCPVGSEGFTPPELLSTDLSRTEQTSLHDRFRLGIIIHLLLFGDYPFKGKWIGAGDSPAPIELLRQGYWSYAPNSLIQPSPLTIPLDVLHPALRDCFLRCFNVGHANPEMRPKPEEWLRALQAARSQLKACKKVKGHWYSETYGKCYWCERKKTLGVDIFPAPGSIRRQKSPLQKRLEGAIATTQRRFQQVIAFTLPQPSINLQPTKSIFPPSPQPTASIPPAATPTSQSPTPTLPTINWKPLGFFLGGITSLFAVLLFLSRSQMDSDNIGLSLFGILLCLGLVGLCFLLLRLTDQSNS